MARLGTLGVVVLAAALVSLPVAAHVNVIEADTQVSADGDVAIEKVFVLVDGYLVVHEDDGGQPGEPIGHRPIATGGGYHFDDAVPVNDTVWREWNGTRTVWVAFHREETGEGFDPADDPIQQGFSGPVAERLSLASGDSPVRIRNGQTEASRLTSNRTTLREVATDRRARVVVRASLANRTDPVVGTTRVQPGVERNVTVPLDDAVFATYGRELTLNATLVADGDPVTVDGAPVRTGFDVARVGNLTVANASREATPVPTTTEAPVATPTPAPTATPTQTATPKPTATADPTAPPTTDAPTTDSTTSGGGAGFGVGVTVAVLAALLVGALRRRP